MVDPAKMNELMQVLNAAVGEHQQHSEAPVLQVVAALRGLRKSVIAMGYVSKTDVEAIEREVDEDYQVFAGRPA